MEMESRIKILEETVYCKKIICKFIMLGGLVCVRSR